MCRNTFMVYQWCHCHEDIEYITCDEHREGKCSSVTDDCVRAYCYCQFHASHKWKSVSQAQKKQAKLEKKKLKNRELDTASSSGASRASSVRSSINSIATSTNSNSSTADVTTNRRHSSAIRRLSKEWLVSRSKLLRRSV